ncbi:MAG: helix-hairpin-helix domain-containing protein [Myxococcales bacterium]|nr:helix-hairpin-helix domain-containing protein [Myxococcales bacterium]
MISLEPIFARADVPVARLDDDEALRAALVTATTAAIAAALAGRAPTEVRYEEERRGVSIYQVIEIVADGALGRAPGQLERGAVRAADPMFDDLLVGDELLFLLELDAPGGLAPAVDELLPIPCYQPALKPALEAALASALAAYVGSTRAFAPGERVELNTASAAALARLPGLHRGQARAIVEHRARVGPFATPEDLLRVDGVGRATLDAILPRVKV